MKGLGSVSHLVCLRERRQSPPQPAPTTTTAPHRHRDHIATSTTPPQPHSTTCKDCQPQRRVVLDRQHTARTATLSMEHSTRTTAERQ